MLIKLRPSILFFEKKCKKSLNIFIYSFFIRFLFVFIRFYSLIFIFIRFIHLKIIFYILYMTFNCIICNYESTLKANYERHLKSKRHLAKVEITSENPPKTLR